LVTIFSKLVNFGPDISASLQSPREGIQDTKILWAKVQKQKSYQVIKFRNMVPIFSKSVNFGPHISELLEIPQEALQGPRILWAKVKKNKVVKGSNFELWSRFSRNLWTLVHSFWHSWKDPWTVYGMSQFYGPKFKNNKVMHQKP